MDPVEITSPADSDVTLRNPAFVGTGDENAEVVVHDSQGVELCRDTVAAGAWSCTTIPNLPDGPVDAEAMQTASDSSTSTDNVSIIVADPLNSPVINPIVTAGAGAILTAGVAMAVVLRRRKYGH